MPLQIDKGASVPLYVQVKRQIERLIRTGSWEPGKKVPTEREMAKKLNVSRNTVSLAYKELEEEGLLRSYQGRGTFVADEKEKSPDTERVSRVRQLLDRAIDESLNLGIGLDEFVRLAGEQAEEKKNRLQSLQVAFIECNWEQLNFFSRYVGSRSGVVMHPILLDDLRADPSAFRTRFEGVDLVVTTRFHLEEVRFLINNSRIEVIGISIEPQMDSMMRIARLPAGSRVGLVCRTEAFANKVRQSIADAGITEIEIVSTITRDPDRLKLFLHRVSSVIVSPGRRRDVEALLPEGVEVIEFIYHPDEGSINILESILLEQQKERSKGSVQNRYRH